MMRPPLPSVNGPAAASWPRSRRPAWYCRWMGRTDWTRSASGTYSMIAANFMAHPGAGSAGAERDRPDPGPEDAPGEEGVRPEQQAGVEQVPDQEVAEEPQRRRLRRGKDRPQRVAGGKALRAAGGADQRGR